MGAPAGWYRDPIPGGGGRLRWWDGTRWTDHVSPSSSPAAPLGKPGRLRRGFGRIAWSAVATFLVLAAVTAYAASRQKVEYVDFKGGKVGFVGSERVQVEKVEEGSDDLKRRVQVLEEQAKAAASSTPTPAATPHLAGDWLGANGLVYRIAQFGVQLVVNEVHPLYGTTGVGQGALEGNRVSLRFQAVDGSFGRADLTYDGGRRLEGVFVNETYGLQSPALLTRT